MRHFRLYLFVTLLALLAGQNTAYADEDTYTFTWAVNSSNSLSRLVITRDGDIVFNKTVSKNPLLSEYNYTFKGDENLYSGRPYSMELRGTLSYSDYGDASVVTNGAFEIFITSSTMKIKKVYVNTTVKNASGEYLELNYNCSPDNRNVVDFQTPAVSEIHIRSVKVVYVPLITLADFTKLDENIYGIATSDDLNNLAYLVNDNYNSCSGVTFRQTDNINFVFNANEVIGFSPSHPFQGTYDGQGFSIKRIYSPYTVASEANYKGLFGYLEDGTVQNVELFESEIAGHYYVGGIVGLNHGGTVRNCRVANVTISGWSDSGSHGGVVGKNESGGSVVGCYSYALLKSSDNSTTFNYGGITGYNNGIVQDCLFDGGTIEATREFGSIVGVNEGSLANNYYNNTNIGGVNGNDTDGACRAREVKMVNVTIDGTQTTYNKSGLTAVGTSVLCYAVSENFTLICSGEGQKISLTYNGDLQAGMAPAFIVNDVFIAGNSFTMPATDVTVVGHPIQANPISVTGYLSDDVYWSTFCHGILRYALPEGATAYTMDAEHHLYRLGDDGRVIPAGVAVVIVADKENITLNYDSSTADIIDHAPDYVNNTPTGGNILRGSNNPVPVADISTGTPYVLGVAGNPAVFGFHPFVPTGTDTSIPAHKAYYVVLPTP